MTHHHIDRHVILLVPYVLYEGSEDGDTGQEAIN